MLIELIPLALVVALSPLSIIPAVLVLHTAAPTADGPGIPGRLAGRPDRVDEHLPRSVRACVGRRRAGEKPPSWASGLRIAVGAALIVFGVYRWLTRKRAAHTPKWMSNLTTIAPRKCRRHGRRACPCQSQGAVHLRRSGFGDRQRRRSGGQAHGWPSPTSSPLPARPSPCPFWHTRVTGERLGSAAAPAEGLDGTPACGAHRRAILIVIGFMVLYKGIHGLGGG